MREPTCEGTIASSKIVEKMSDTKVNDELSSLPIEVRKAFLAVAIAMSVAEPGDMDDFECDLDDIIWPILKK